MKVSYISDLHLDFWCPFTMNQLKWEQRTKEFVEKLVATDESEKEVLCLGGDYSHYNHQTMWMLDVFSKHYEQVFMVFGNHDFYLVSRNQANKYKNKSANRIEEIDKNALNNYENVIPLHSGRTWDYKGVKFGGDTMWYPVETFHQKVFYNDISNDSRYIKGFDINFENYISISDYSNMMDEGIDVMISHVPLIHINSHENYASTACYYTPVDMLPKYVIQAHSHERAVYEKSGSLLYMNCLGYPNNHLGKPEIRSFEL